MTQKLSLIGPSSSSFSPFHLQQSEDWKKVWFRFPQIQQLFTSKPKKTGFWGFQFYLFRFSLFLQFIFPETEIKTFFLSNLFLFMRQPIVGRPLSSDFWTIFLLLRFWKSTVSKPGARIHSKPPNHLVEWQRTERHSLYMHQCVERIMASSMKKKIFNSYVELPADLQILWSMNKKFSRRRIFTLSNFVTKRILQRFGSLHKYFL